MDLDNGLKAIGLNLEMVAELPIEQLFKLTMKGSQPIQAAPNLITPEELNNPQVGIRLAYTLQEILNNTNRVEELDLPAVQRSWKAMVSQLDHCLSNEGQRQLASALSERCPDSIQCARLEMTAVLSWLDPLIGELTLAD